MTPFIIAEIGINHNGDLSTALEMVQAAAACGADAVKFQSFRTRNIVRIDARAKAHLKRDGDKKSLYDTVRRWELSARDFEVILAEARRQNIFCFTSVFDKDSLAWVKKFNLPLIKIPSGEITNLELIRATAALNLPMIISTGMSTLAEVETALSVVGAGRKLVRTAAVSRLRRKFPVFNEGVVLLHTTNLYPAPPGSLNLSALETLRKSFACPVGYSDHSDGYAAAAIAISRGAYVVEKHFTLDRTMDGPDHAASMEPGEFQDFVKVIKGVPAMMGTGLKTPANEEREMIPLFRKSIVAERDIPAGTVVKRSMLGLKRPADGIPANMLHTVLGLKTCRKIREGSSLDWDDFKRPGRN